MLLQFVAAVVALLVLAAALSGSTLTFLETRQKVLVDAYLSQGVASSENQLLSNLQQGVMNGTTASLTVSPPAPCPSAPCDYTVQASVAAEGQTAGPSAGADTAHNLQPLASEAYQAYLLTVSLQNADGLTLGTRVAQLTVRTYTGAPFVTVVGQRIIGVGSQDDIAEGNPGGCDPTAQASCYAVPLGTTPADTQIHIMTDNGGTIMPTSAPPQTKNWNNANAAATNWKN